MGPRNFLVFPVPCHNCFFDYVPRDIFNVKVITTVTKKKPKKMTSNCCSIPILGRKRYLNVYLDACPAIVV